MIRGVRCLSALLVAQILAAGPLSAQAGADATLVDMPEIRPGAYVLSGTLADGIQDLWSFTVPASTVPALYSATVEGLGDTGGALGIIAIERNDAGEVTRRQDVSIAGIRPSYGPAARVAQVGPIMLAPGDYLLGVTPLIAGEGAYELRFMSETPASLEEGAGSVPFGLWHGSTGTGPECLSLPPELLDVSLQEPPTAELTVWLRDDEGRDRERAGIDAGWQISGLDGATHDLCISGRDGNAWVARIAPAASPERDPEPNGAPETALTLSVEETRTARIDPRGSGRDIDLYRIPGGADARDLRVTAGDRGKVAYDLLTLDGERLKTGERGVEFEISPYLRGDDLLLSVTGDPGTDYDVALLSYPAPGDSEDAEPNDTIASATPWSPDRPAQGILDQDDVDTFSLVLDQPAQLWRLQGEGDGVTRLRVYDASGTLITERRASAGTLLRISGLYMIPGRYSVQIEGDGLYTLRLLPLGPRRDDAELEPNEDGQELRVGQPLRGQLDPADVDRFRFTVHASEWLRLRVSPPLGERISVYMLAEGGEVFRHFVTGGKSTMDYTREFWAGDYQIEIETDDGISGLDDYSIVLEPAELPFGPRTDREPNDYAHSAEDWPEDGRPVGRVGAVQQDKDGYRLRDVASGADLRFCGLPEAISISVVGADGGTIRRTVDKTETGPCDVFAATSTGDLVVFVEQNSTGARTELPTDYEIVPGGSAVRTLGAAPASTAIAMVMTDPPPTPKSFLADFTQRLPLRIEAKAVDPDATVDLSLAASEPGWAIDLTGSAARDDGTSVLTADLVAPPDLDEREVRLHLRLRTGDGEGTVSFSLTPDAGTAARTPERSFPVPEAMLGGLNMAAATFGGTIAALDGSDLGKSDPPGTRRAAALIDGLSIASKEFSFDKVSSEALFTFRLGGDAPVPLAGLLLTPRAAPGGSRTLRDFRVEASADGVTFSEVLEARLGAEPIEQAFVFDTPVIARALRLIPETNWTHGSNADGPIRLGEFKAVATPGWMPDGDRALNLADPALGGHVAWTDPPGAISRDWDRDVLVGGDTAASLLRDASSLSLAIGFHHARVARIAAIDWTMASADLPVDYATPASRVVVSASTEGPLGPWTEVAVWSPPPDAPPESPARLELKEPVWARYLRFDMSALATADYLRLPERLGVWEAPPTPDAPSILGEWGEFAQASAFERLTAPEPAVIPPPAGGADAGTAVPAPTNVWIASSVRRGVRSDWWEIAPSPERRELRLTLDTARQGGAQPELMDENGNTASIRQANQAETEARGLETPLFLADLAGDVGYKLHIEEPLRPIIVVWDTSGSTTPYKPAMQRALRDIARRADPERDLIGFLPFGGDLLGDGLLGDPELLIRRLGTEVPGGDSSAAETALVRASGYLARQNGVRGVILITDAATGRDVALWPALDSVRPRIGALAIPSTGAFGPDPDRERDLMETWSRVNGGFYDYVSTQADFTEGFGRAVDRMRGHKPYRMLVGFGPAVAQPPGRLRVVGPEAGDEPAEESTSLLVLLDTSGSMLQRLDGRRRYQIAFDALAQLGASAKARGMPMGLRRFGIEPGTCDSEVVAPVAPTDGDAIAGLLDGVVPQNNARTPLALALEAAARDLSPVEGVRRVVVLTDGEETCDGDPEQAIRALAEAGIATRIDIVGFAIEDADLSATFGAWARLGNGVYTSARDADGLARALLDATERSFRVRAADGTMRAGTVGGEAIVLPPRRYELFVDGLADPVPVEVAPDSESVVDLAK